MGLILTDAGARSFLNMIFNDSWPTSGTGYTLKLFSNNMTAADTDVASGYAEASGGGYVSKALSNGSWSVSTTSNPPEAVYTAQTWIFDSTLTTAVYNSGSSGVTATTSIYGYYIVNDNGLLLWAEQMDSPFTPSISGDRLTITPRFSLSKGTPT